jgi:hypothetical protein
MQCVINKVEPALSMHLGLKLGLILIGVFLLDSTLVYAKCQGKGGRCQNQAPKTGVEEPKKISVPAQKIFRKEDCKECILSLKDPETFNFKDAKDLGLIRIPRDKERKADLIFFRASDPKEFEDLYPIGFRATPFYAPNGFDIIRFPIF